MTEQHLESVPDPNSIDEIYRILQQNGIPLHDVPPAPVVGRPVARHSYYFLGQGAPQSTESVHAAAPDEDETVYAMPPASEHEDGVTVVQGEALEDDDSEGLSIFGESEDGKAGPSDGVAETNYRKRALIIAGGVSALALTVGAYAYSAKDDRLDASRLPKGPGDVAVSVAPTPDTTKQHHHKPKHTPAANPGATPESTPTSPATSEPTPTTPEVVVPIAPTTFRIGAQDVYTSGNQNDATYSIDQWRERLAKTVDVVKKHLDVGGLRDVRENQWQGLRAEDMLGTGYGMFPTDYGTYASRNPVFWRSDLFEMVEGHTMTGSHSADLTDHPNSVTVVLLKSVETGQKFYVINSVAPDGATPEAFQARADSALRTAELVRNLETSDQKSDKESALIPVFVLADMSDDPNVRPGSSAGVQETTSENNPYCTLTGIAHLVSAYAIRKSSDLPLARECTRDDRMPTNQLYFSSGIMLQDYQYRIGPKRNGSKDDRLLVAEVTTPGVQPPLIETSPVIPTATLLPFPTTTPSGAS